MASQQLRDQAHSYFRQSSMLADNSLLPILSDAAAITISGLAELCCGVPQRRG